MAPPVAGYTAWYDATLITGVSDGAHLSTWNDSSGNGHHLVSQHTSANQPVYYSTTTAQLINGHPAVWFVPGTPGGLTCLDTFSQPHPFTIIVVCQASSLSGAPVLWCVNTGSTSQYQIVPTTNWRYSQIGLGNFDFTFGPSTTTTRFLCAIFNGASSSLQQDNLLAGAGLTSETWTATLNVGAYNDGASDPWFGPICEVIVYPSALSAANVTTLQNYLSTKWGSPAAPPVPGPSAWYDASQIHGQADNTALTTWNDLSGTGNTLSVNTTPPAIAPTYFKTTSAKLVNGLPAVWYTAHASMLGLGGVNQALTLCAALMDIGGSGSADMIVSGSNGNMDTRWNDSTHQFGANGVYAATGTYAPNVPHVVTLVLNSALSSVTVDHDATVLLTASPGGSGFSTVLNVGAYAGGSSNAWNGPLCEILIYPTALSSTDIATVQTYLINKWLQAPGALSGSISSASTLSATPTQYLGTATLTSLSTLTAGTFSGFLQSPLLSRSTLTASLVSYLPTTATLTSTSTLGPSNLSNPGVPVAHAIVTDRSQGTPILS